MSLDEMRMAPAVVTKPTYGLDKALDEWNKAFSAEEPDGAFILATAGKVHEQIGSLDVLQRMRADDPGRPQHEQIEPIDIGSPLLTTFLQHFPNAPHGSSEGGRRLEVSPQIKKVRDHGLSGDKPQRDPNPIAA